MNPKVDQYISRSQKWSEEQAKLRQIVLDCNLTEELKWGVPCYTWQNSNIVLIHEFKEYCGILFPKGALLKDPYGILVQQTINVQAARQVRFTNLQEVLRVESFLKEYILEAVEAEKAGLKVEMKKVEQFEIVEEFRSLVVENPKLKEAFEALTPGRQRAYLLYFSAPKQAKTREARVGKYIPKILDGKGLDD